jgi:hypothetical protein
LIGFGAKPALRRGLFKTNSRAESDDSLTKLQDLLVYLIPQLTIIPSGTNSVLK